MRGTIVLRLVGAAILLAGLIWANVGALNAAPTVEIEPTTTPGAYKFRARGFYDEEGISFWVTGPNGQVQGIGDNKETDSRGRLTIERTLPRHFQPGRWAITAHGQRSRREAIGYFELPYRAPNAVVLVTPAQVPTTSAMTIAGSGFGRNDVVSFWFTAPDGRTIPGANLVQATHSGDFTFPYLLGPSAQVGTWTVSAYGMKSDHFGVAVFEFIQ
jgi:hypothetical protein